MRASVVRVHHAHAGTRRRMATRGRWRADLRRACAAVLAALAMVAGVSAQGTPPAALGAAGVTDCDAAARIAARETGVPRDILFLIARLESGRGRDGQLAPWPWTLNIAGRGYWIDTHHEALARLQAYLSTGRRNVDVGCFQVNHRWHAEGFASAAAMLDPLANARYAARFLARLHRELGDWTAAVAAYHSRTPDHAARYLDRYRALRARFTPPVGAEPSGEREPAQPRRGPRPAAPLSMARRPPLSVLAGRSAAPFLIAPNASPLPRMLP
ncbi:hypothetical protein roselon_01328 [Roseibacterium elongatum DSM 19469]|uniref:Transglycosylase SLT domain-containing protein n=1 Tax=Roseicyclus elongatus DSM 19469 TaxID=1294273 RepID=W8S4I6_9RHOB|nr:transglycosylase SLT domain-containing protein [Roseibacterium elongatum]AHM03716.1 hypothetical protein roselon_01328 [Roseibacterium elongatum DSM 19469]